METDLHRIIYSRQELTDDHIQYFIYQVAVYGMGLGEYLIHMFMFAVARFCALSSTCIPPTCFTET